MVIVIKNGLGFMGIDKARVQDVYYFDSVKQNYRVSSTKEVILVDSGKELYTFGTDGITIAISCTCEVIFGLADAVFKAFIGSKEQGQFAPVFLVINA